jgi:hypothetical protein
LPGIHVATFPSPAIYLQRHEIAASIMFSKRSSSTRQPQPTRWTTIAGWALLGAFGVMVVLIPQKPDRAAMAASLRDASQRGDLGGVEQALACGALVDAPDEIGVTALIEAARAGRARVVARLIGAGADVNQRTGVLGTPLIQATMYDHADVMRILLQHGADANIRNEYGNDALWFAFTAQNQETIALLVDAGAQLPPEFGSHGPQ